MEVVTGRGRRGASGVPVTLLLDLGGGRMDRVTELCIYDLSIVL